ncbi:histidine phosphatase family protein [Zunongwangia sp. SCSIO 43204]|uniref:SixA phosphatase family protein n=1 Tax=Zunongwangia sp. SCSIO 43204 TaxID=2779359 RepID=UPI001CA9586A|nr:histidine phosphatase family protein [Zunongwangia sp. SCSIO 43204]UAB82955.1 histidine phosphatase family protein [Zunongwangia sp. SCSIO 43204]
MKRLVVVRHGKSSWKYDVPDHERPLKKRAKKDAKAVLGVFKAFYLQNIESATFWSSYAVRAHETAKIFKKELEIKDEDFEVKKALYTFSSGDLKNIIRKAPDSIETLVIFSHNPGITGLVNHSGDQKFHNIPTTGLCVIEFEEDHWDSISTGKTLLSLFPKNLR